MNESEAKMDKATAATNNRFEGFENSTNIGVASYALKVVERVKLMD